MKRQWLDFLRGMEKKGLAFRAIVMASMFLSLAVPLSAQENCSPSQKSIQEKEPRESPINKLTFEELLGMKKNCLSWGIEYARPLADCNRDKIGKGSGNESHASNQERLLGNGFLYLVYARLENTG